MSYKVVTSHKAMIFDHNRNGLYQKAILDAVTPDSVVLDLGSGLGLLGFIAAKAGAKKVYLVDPSPVILAAKQVAKENGLTNIECIQSTAEDLQLPEKVDLIISVFTGNFLLTEDLLPSLFKARDKFLKKNGVMIPDRARMIVAPVSMPKYYQNNIDCWSDSESDQSIEEQFDVDYHSIKNYATNTVFYDGFNDAEREFLAESKIILDLDFYSAKKAACLSKTAFEIHTSGTCHGWLGWFDARLGDCWLSTGPDEKKLHWSQVFLPLTKIVSVEKNKALVLDLKRPEYSDWTWTTLYKQHKKMVSTTFLSAPMVAETISKNAETYKPELGVKGELLKVALGLFDGQKSSKYIAEQLLKNYGDSFDSQKDASRYVQGLIDQFIKV